MSRLLTGTLSALLALSVPAVATTVLLRPNDRVFQGDNTGVKDISAEVTRYFEAGGHVRFAPGDYFIAGQGDDAGGIRATLTKSLYVTCMPGARFFTDSLDNDMIRLQVPSDGAGLPTTGIDVKWHGCLIDQQNQKVSNVVPFAAEYPPPAGQDGTSNTADGLSIEGTYTSGGEQNGINLLEVTGVTCYAGSHWELAGGDSCIIVGGAKKASVHDNVCTGSRDLCVYASGSSLGVNSGRIDVVGNNAYYAFNGFSVKRSTFGFSMRENYCNGGVICINPAHVIGAGAEGGSVVNNRFEAVQVGVRADLSLGLTIKGNRGKNWGAYEADGTTPVTAYSAIGVWVHGTRYSTIEDNFFNGVSASYAALNPVQFLLDSANNGVSDIDAEYNRVANNLSIGFHGPGGETSGEANHNQFDSNRELTGAAPDVIADGAQTSIIRYDWSVGLRSFQTPLAFLDSTCTAPLMRRFGDGLTGIGFQSNRINACRPIAVARGVIAAAGTDQATGTVVPNTADIIRVSTVLSGEGIVLPACDVSDGMSVKKTVLNDGANDLAVYPFLGDFIRPGLVNSPSTVTAGTVKTFHCGAQGIWYPQ